MIVPVLSLHKCVLPTSGLRSIFLSVIALCCVFFLGCSWVGGDPIDASAVNEAVEVERDDFKGTMFYNGPTVSNKFEHGIDAPEIEEISLSARMEKDQPMRFFLNVIDYYEGDWRGYDQAFDAEGNKFHALAVRHKVNCHFFCGFDEVLQIELDPSYLKKHIQSGVAMRLYGPAHSASAPFNLPGAYIQGFLKGSYD